MQVENYTNQFNIIEDLNSQTFWDYSKPNLVINGDSSPIEIEDNSSLTIIELFDKNSTISKINREIILEENSSLEYIKITNSNIDIEFEYTIKSEKNTTPLLHLFEIGKTNIKNTINSKLEEKDINLQINALVKLDEKATAFNSFDITHIHQNTFSDIKIRHLLDDNSKAEFEATTVIENNALYSKAFQDSKTILLNDDALIKARPHLEILTDELEAGHGATTGGIDKDALYYLMSRGLNEKTAYKILIEAFYNSSVENIKNTAIKEWLYEQIRI